jgi:hypothetical protein
LEAFQSAHSKFLGSILTTVKGHGSGSEQLNEDRRMTLLLLGCQHRCCSWKEHVLENMNITDFPACVASLGANSSIPVTSVVREVSDLLGPTYRTVLCHLTYVLRLVCIGLPVYSIHIRLMTSMASAHGGLTSIEDSHAIRIPKRLYRV